MLKFKSPVVAASTCVSLFLIASQLQAGSHDEPQATSAAVEMAASDVVRARRTAYFLSTQAVGQIKSGIAEDGNLDRSAAAARMLAQWAATLPSLFPEGTEIEGSKALPNIWTDRAGFEAAADAYRVAALDVAEVARTGDREATNAAFMEMAATCKACHDTYRR